MEAVRSTLTHPTGLARLPSMRAHPVTGTKDTSPRAKYDTGAEKEIQNTFLNYATKVKAIRAATNEYHDP